MGFSLKIRWPTLEKQFLWKFRRPLRTFFFSSVGLRFDCFFFCSCIKLSFYLLKLILGFHFISFRLVDSMSVPLAFVSA